MERRVRGNSHARCGAGEKLEIKSNAYLSLSMGWFVHFKEILEHVQWQIHDWQSVYGDVAINECRVVVLVF